MCIYFLNRDFFNPGTNEYVMCRYICWLTEWSVTVVQSAVVFTSTPVVWPPTSDPTPTRSAMAVRSVADCSNRSGVWWCICRATPASIRLSARSVENSSSPMVESATTTGSTPGHHRTRSHSAVWNVERDFFPLMVWSTIDGHTRPRTLRWTMQLLTDDSIDDDYEYSDDKKNTFCATRCLSHCRIPIPIPDGVSGLHRPKA